MPLARVPGMRQPSSNLSPEELSVWDEGDSYSVPPPNMRDANDDIDTVQDAPRAATAFDRYNESVRRSADHMKTAPRESEFRPNKWQRLAAAGANFAAGYVNAGGRTRVDPGAMQAVNSSLLRPGYDRAQQKWQEQGRVLQADERAAGMEAQSEAAQTKRQMDMERAEAYKKAQASSASYNSAREKKLGEDPWRVSPNGKVLYNSAGETKNLPQDPGKPPTPSESEKMKARIDGPKPPGFEKLTQEQQTTWMATGRIPAAPRPRGTGKSKEDRSRFGTPGQRHEVTSKKIRSLSKIEEEFDKEVDAINKEYSEAPATDPRRANWGKKLEEINSRREKAKQVALEVYDEGVRGFGGNVVPRGAKPAAPPSGSGRGPKIGDERSYNGGTYRFDGSQWVLR